MLNRGTLELVANRRYNHGSKPLGEYLETLQPGVDLAILVLQPAGGGEINGLESAIRIDRRARPVSYRTAPARSP